jgi:small neutral amino acid transporter SnatA (MarC family)
MIENFIAAFIVYFVVIDPVGTAPIFLAITTHLNKRQKSEPRLKAPLLRVPSCYFLRSAAYGFCII